jgi:hypothetical protein
LALAVNRWLKRRKITMLDAVAKAYSKPYVVSLGWILFFPELVAALVELPVLEFTVDPDVPEGFASLPSIPRSLAFFVEHRVQKSGPRYRHDDEIVWSSKG